MIDVDDKNSSRYFANVAQYGLTLPDRDYYLGDKENYTNARQALTVYIERLYELAKLPAGTAAAANILKLEISLAQAHWSKTECQRRKAIQPLPYRRPRETDREISLAAVFRRLRRLESR